MRTVLVIGAGGSLAQAESLRRARTTEHPPLDGDFFVKAESLARNHGDISRRLRALREQLEKSGLFYDPLAPTPIPMEQFFADVYYEVASQRNNAAYEVFLRLVRLYMWVLAVTTNWMAVRQDTGDVDRLIQAEIRRAVPDRVTIRG